MRLKVSPVCWKKFRRLKYVTETKNLFDVNNAAPYTFTNDNPPSSRISLKDGIYTTTYNNHNVGSGLRIKDGLVLSPGTYTLSLSVITVGETTPITGLTYGFRLYKSDGTKPVITTYTEKFNSRCSHMFTIPGDCTDIRLYLAPHCNSGQEYVYISLKDIQVEKGSTATPYQPYGYLPLNRGKYIANKEPVQLLDKSKYPATFTESGVTFTNNGDGTITVNGTTNAVYVNYIIPIPQFKEVKNDHKYVLFSGINDISDDSLFECIFFLGRQDGSYFVRDCAETKLANTVGFVIPQGEYPLWQRVELRVRRGYMANDLTFKPQLFDLTAMYGAGNEPTTVEQFRADYPNELYDYNPYNAITFR